MVSEILRAAYRNFRELVTKEGLTEVGKLLRDSAYQHIGITASFQKKTVMAK